MEYGNILLMLAGFPMAIFSFHCARAFFEAETHTVRLAIWMVFADMVAVLHETYKKLSPDTTPPMWMLLILLPLTLTGIVRIYFTLYLISNFENVYSAPGLGWVITTYAVYLCVKAIDKRYPNLWVDKTVESDTAKAFTTDDKKEAGLEAPTGPIAPPPKLRFTRSTIPLFTGGILWILATMYAIRLSLGTIGTDRLAVLVMFCDLTIAYYDFLASAFGDHPENLALLRRCSGISSSLSLFGMLARLRLYFARWTFFVKVSFTIFAALQAKRIVPPIYRHVRNGTLEATIQTWMSALMTAVDAPRFFKEKFMKEQVPQVVKDRVAKLKETCKEVQRWDSVDEDRLRAWRPEFEFVKNMEDDDLLQPYVGGWGTTYSCGRVVESIDWLLQNGLEEHIDPDRPWRRNYSHNYEKKRIQSSVAEILAKFEKAGI